MEQLRQERVRERDIFNLNIARMKNEYVAKLKEVEVREREMTLREKEGKKLTCKHHKMFWPVSANDGLYFLAFTGFGQL